MSNTNAASGAVSEASHLYQVDLPVETLDIRISFICYQSLSFLPASSEASPTACSYCLLTMLIPDHNSTPAMIVDFVILRTWIINNCTSA